MFQTDTITIEEPEFAPVEISFPVERRAGTMGQVAVQWQAMVSEQEAVSDLLPSSGELHFAAGETIKTLKVEVLPDDIPEITEVRVHMCMRTTTTLSPIMFSMLIQRCFADNQVETHWCH